MKKPKFRGDFFPHPVNLVAIAVLVFNNHWLKPSGLCPLLAGKLSDIAIMIFLPTLICLGVELFRHLFHTFHIAISKNKSIYAQETYVPSKILVLISIFISALLMTVLQISNTASNVYNALICYLNDLLFFGRTTHESVQDISDLISLLFLIIPYFLLVELSISKGPRDSMDVSNALL